MSTRGEFMVAAVQGTPAYLDREATLDSARPMSRVGVTACSRGCDVPRDLPGATGCTAVGDADDYLSRGNTTIVAPGGEVLQGSLVGAAGTVTAVLELDRIAAGRRAFDPTGHYAPPHVLTLTINENGDHG